MGLCMFLVVIEIMYLYDDDMIVIIVKIADNPVIMIYTVVYVCKLTFNNKHDTWQTILFLLIVSRYRRLSECELTGDGCYD